MREEQQTYNTWYYTISVRKTQLNNILNKLRENQIETLQIGNHPKEDNKPVYLYLTADTANKLNSILSMNNIKVIHHIPNKFGENTPKFEWII